MKVLLDTHALLWMLGRSDRLSSRARSIIADTEHDLFFSIAGYWEIGIKISLGKLDLVENWHESIPVAMTKNGISWLQISPAHIHALSRLPWMHRDPFDRLFIAQAEVEKLVILSADSAFAAYGVKVVW